MPTAVRVTSDTLVGRGEELGSALAALRDLREGRPAVVAVSGQAGIGKTRFVTALADQLRADGALVMAGTCLGAGAPPYSALIAAFRSVDPPSVQLLDVLTGAVEMRRSKLFELLRSTMTALARRRPTMLVVEDLHWLDRITRDALIYLMSMVREGRWALIVTYRGDEIAARPAAGEFLEPLLRDALVRMTLDAFSVRDVASQIAAITGATASPERVAACYRRSGGIPLLVEEVLAAEMSGAAGVPDHLRDLFLARVRRLGGTAAAAVEAVAVVSDRCGDRLIAQIVGSNRPAAAAALDRAVVADVLVADRKGYRMRHELLREAVYDALPLARRRRLHAKAAAAMTVAAHRDAPALAHHWYEADEPVQAALANFDAAALAERVHAPGEVRVYLERVAEYFDALPADHCATAGGRGALLARTAEAAYLSGDFARAVALMTDSLGEPGDAAVAAVRWERLARYCWTSRNGAGAQHAHEQSVAMLGDGVPSHARARVLSGYSWYLAMASRFGDARKWSQQALVAAESSGDRLDSCRALLAWGYARAAEGPGLAALWQARDLAVTCDAGEELARAHTALDLSLRQQGRTAEREQVLRDGLGYVAVHGLDKSYAPAMNYLLAELLLNLGRWDEAEEILDVLAACRLTGVPAMFTHAYRAKLAASRGHTASVASSADLVATLSADLPQQPIPLSTALSARAESCLWAGEAGTANEYAEHAEAITIDRLVKAEATAIRAWAIADLADRARKHGRPLADPPASAERAAKAGLEESHPQIRALAATALAELSRRDGQRNPVPWRQAVAAWDEAPDPYRAAYCRWRLAHALLATRAGRREATRELAAARCITASLRARPLRTAIENLAAAARLQLAAGDDAIEARVAAPAAAAAGLGLTHREMEVLPLLVAGRTNAEIARAFVLSPRTVDVHVSRILHKLGATRRTEAADMARRRGLVDD